MKKRSILLLLILAALVSCSVIPGTAPAEDIPQPAMFTVDPNLPGVESAARGYLDAWKAGDFSAMYNMLTPISQAALSREDFTKHYQGVAVEAALTGVDYQVLSTLTRPDQAQVSYRVILHSELVGDIQADTLMNLSLEKGEWRVQWDDTLVLPQLKGDHYLSMDRQGYIPARGNIYDRNGHALVAQTDAVAIGLYPDQLDPAQEQLLFSELFELTGLREDTIKAMYANFPVGQGWYLPLAEAPAEKVVSRSDILTGLSGLVLTPYKARYYFDGIAPHVVGYMGQIPEDQLAEYEKLGYRPGDRIGLSGLERWGESYLAGKRGGALYVRNAQGQPVTLLAKAPAQPAQSIYTTIDREFQDGVQQAIAGFEGAVVVMERDTGRILAMVSSPGFNPNAFEPVNFNSEQLLADFSDPSQPLFNRATQGLYPLGSVFKIITMATALESGIYSPKSTYYCDTVFKELPGTTLYDWTYQFKEPASGLLTLPGGLIRSCNPWFYHIGLDLFNRDLGNLVPEMARGFGLGSPTGIEGVDEAIGQVPELENGFDATNLAIGQGALQVTPLQVATFTAALGNGGNLLRPQVIERVVSVDGKSVLEFKPQARGKLPISEATLQTIREAMIGVVESVKPRGTAQHVFVGLDIPVAGKTGTAQTAGAPHAWFTGYTFAEQEDHPDIAMVVVADNAGEGSGVAAPIFRRIVELYFYGIPGKLYDWESTYNITRTPPPEGVSTPVP